MDFFSGGKGGGKLVEYGYKGKGMTTHLLVDGNGSPLSFEVTSAKGDERQQVEKLVDPILNKLRRVYKLYDKIPILEADKGYDSEELRNKLLKRKIYPFIPRRRMGVAKKAGVVVCLLQKWRWQAERAISWLQRKFRRVVVRWEREIKYWKGFLNFSIIKYWIDRLSGYPA